jgi:acyl-CoA synthetase (AMP-forming)/AMP-acid ligase II
MVAGTRRPATSGCSTKSLPRNASGKFLKKDLRESLKVEDAA